MSGVRLSRRRLLAAAAAAAATAAAALPDPLLPWAMAGEADATLPARALLAAVFSDPQRAGALGAGCLPLTPAGRPSSAALAQALLAEHGGTFRSISPSRRAASVRARIRRDFAAEEMVNINGWLLSATEARLYALASLLAGNHEIAVVRS